MLYGLLAFMSLGLIDSYFISFLGTDELAAIGFIVPITALIQSIGLGLGMAISSLTSKLIGADRMSSAARLISNGFYLTAIIGLITITLLFVQRVNIFTLIGADSIVMPHILTYMNIWVIAAPLVMGTMVCSSTFRAIGDTVSSAKIAIVMSLVNIILDPLLIFGLGPFPELGMRGAALATVIAVLASCFIGIYQLRVKERLLIWTLPAWLEFKKSIAELLEIAIPAILANCIVPLAAAILITLVATFGNDAVAGYGVGMRVEGIAMVIIYALSSTLPVFIGQNLGAGNKQRVYLATRLSFRFVLLLQLGIYIVLVLLDQPIAKLFSEDEAVQNTIRTFFWIIPISYGLSGIVILINVAMNVLGKPRLALYINVLRLVLFYIPFAYLGGQWFGINGLFIGIALGNCCAFLLANVLFNRILTELDIKA